jgi:hypothetical protein
VQAGPTYPLSTVATVRSNSPSRGDTRDDSETKTSGAASRTSFSTASSCSGLANDHRKATATLSSRCSATNAVTAALAWPSSRATAIFPPASTRSCSSRTAPGTISGAGSDVPRTRNTSSRRRPATRPCPRIMARASPCPAVVITPTRAPVRSSTALVPIVVPCPNRPVWPSRSGSDRLTLVASSARPATTPSAGSPGVDSVFAVRYAVTWPSVSAPMRTQS